MTTNEPFIIIDAHTHPFAGPNGIYPNTLAIIEEAELTDVEKTWVLGKTCATLFGISLPA